MTRALLAVSCRLALLSGERGGNGDGKHGVQAQRRNIPKQQQGTAFFHTQRRTKGKITYTEAARWLLYVNAYDDHAGKPKGKNLPMPGIGLLGKLGLITAEGGNLFETLLLNMVLLPGRRLWEKPENLCWKLEKSRSGERVQITIPRNAAELLTLQSRRILLQRQNDAATGYTLLGGDFLALHGKLGYETKKASMCEANEEQARSNPLIFFRCRSYSWRSHDDPYRAKAKA